MPSGNESEDDNSGDEEPPLSTYCLTCEHVCGCPVDIASSSEELMVGETLAPSAAVKKGKRKLETILDQSFSHETWKFG